MPSACRKQYTGHLIGSKASQKTLLVSVASAWRRSESRSSPAVTTNLRLMRRLAPVGYLHKGPKHFLPLLSASALGNHLCLLSAPAPSHLHLVVFSCLRIN